MLSLRIALICVRSLHFSRLVLVYSLLSILSNSHSLTRFYACFLSFNDSSWLAMRPIKITRRLFIIVRSREREWRWWMTTWGKLDIFMILFWSLIWGRLFLDGRRLIDAIFVWEGMRCQRYDYRSQFEKELVTRRRTARPDEEMQTNGYWKWKHRRGQSIKYLQPNQQNDKM